VVGDVHVVCVYDLESQQERGLTWYLGKCSESEAVECQS
jgi:hypothetical protein